MRKKLSYLLIMLHLSLSGCASLDAARQYSSQAPKCKACTEQEKQAEAAGSMIVGAAFIGGLVYGYVSTHDQPVNAEVNISPWISVPLAGFIFAAVAYLPFWLITGKLSDSRMCCKDDIMPSGIGTAPAGDGTDSIKNQYYWDAKDNVYKKKAEQKPEKD